MRISDWSSDVCSSDLTDAQRLPIVAMGLIGLLTSRILTAYQLGHIDTAWEPFFAGSLSDPRNGTEERSEEHTSELPSLMRISYAVFCLKKKNNIHHALLSYRMNNTFKLSYLSSRH